MHVRLQPGCVQLLPQALPHTHGGGKLRVRAHRRNARVLALRFQGGKRCRAPAMVVHACVCVRVRTSVQGCVCA